MQSRKKIKLKDYFIQSPPVLRQVLLHGKKLPTLQLSTARTSVRMSLVLSFIGNRPSTIAPRTCRYKALKNIQLRWCQCWYVTGHIKVLCTQMLMTVHQ